MHKRKLFIRNYPIVPRKPNKKNLTKKQSDKKQKTTKIRRNLFRVAFKGVELLWMIVQIIQYIKQIFY